jgi:hypothetical protein
MWRIGGGGTIAIRREYFLGGKLTSCAALFTCIVLAVASPATPASAQRIAPEILARLTEPQERAYVLYLRARAAFEVELQAYWIAVDDKRDVRKKRRIGRQSYSANDYIAEQPPKYEGPSLPPEIAKIVTDIKPPVPDEPKPGVTEFLAAAQAEYGFIPSRVGEREFKLRYAEEALSLGLTKDQVVRVYTLETGGRGTHDMQAGVDPDSKKGRPISSAIGYAQLLNANSISELVKHGEAFISRLQAMATVPGTSPQRAIELRQKAITLRKMLRVARTVPNEWGAHIRLSSTSPGMGIHPLNLDADVGPWLQVIKLKGLKQDAERAGRPQLAGAEIELMNLAGPRTGLEMMEPLGRTMPTSNYFSQAAYYRNTIVREKTAADLLAALNHKMDSLINKAGSVEFASAFDEAATRIARRVPQR